MVGINGNFKRNLFICVSIGLIYFENCIQLDFINKNSLSLAHHFSFLKSQNLALKNNR